jgi:hypothetical protein
MLETRSPKKKSQDAVRPADSVFSYNSRTRNEEFQFERVPASFVGWTDCAYKVPQFSYRRPDQAALSRSVRGTSRRRISYRRNNRFSF